MNQAPGRTRKTKTPEIFISTDLNPIIMQEQEPSITRPMWIGKTPEGGLYAEMEEWPESWRVIVRSARSGNEHREHKTMEEVTEYLKEFFGRGVTFRGWKDRKKEVEDTGVGY